MTVDAVIERKDPKLPRYAVIPAEVVRALGVVGRETTLCEVTFADRVTERRTIKHWDDDRWFVQLTDELCRELGADVGATVRVALAVADESVPPELAAALAADPAAKARFDAMPLSHRREHMEHVRGAKKPETRAKRAEATVRRLKA